MARAVAGFTLVELLVVLAVLGLLGAAVLLTAPIGRDPLRHDAERLAAQLQRAQQEAILGTRAVEVAIDGDGYAFAVQRLDGWQPLEAAPFRSSEWSEGVRPRLPREPARMVFRFDATGAAEPTSLTLARGAAQARLTVDAAGEVRLDDAARAP